MRMFARERFAGAAALALLALGAVSCSDVRPEGVYPNRVDRSNEVYAKPDSVFGSSGASIGSGSRDAQAEAGGGIGVNGYLWRASLDTVAFMPVTSADPFGGVIITDWYALPESPDERFKMNVYILGRALRSDGVRVALFRQVPAGADGWRDAPVPAQATTRIEDAILARARQLRFDSLQAQQ